MSTTATLNIPEAGSIVYIRTTEEPCFVLGVKGMDAEEVGTLPDPTEFSGKKVIVRRPILTENGIKHAVDQFLLEEVETLFEKQNRAYADMASFKDQFSTGTGGALQMQKTPKSDA